MEPSLTERVRLENLAGYRHSVERIRAAWPGFLARMARLGGNFPPAGANPARAYRQLAEALEQLGIDPQIV